MDEDDGRTLPDADRQRRGGAPPPPRGGGHFQSAGGGVGRGDATQVSARRADRVAVQRVSGGGGRDVAHAVHVLSTAQRRPRRGAVRVESFV